MAERTAFTFAWGSLRGESNTLSRIKGVVDFLPASDVAFQPEGCLPVDDATYLGPTDAYNGSQGCLANSSCIVRVPMNEGYGLLRVLQITGYT